MVKKVITNVDSSKASGPAFIPAVVLKNCESELSYILSELFNMCLEVSCFPDCWKVSLVVPIFKNIGERSATKKYRSVRLLSVHVVSKVLVKLVNNRLVDHLKVMAAKFSSLGLFTKMHNYNKCGTVRYYGLNGWRISWKWLSA